MSVRLAVLAQTALCSAAAYVLVSTLNTMPPARPAATPTPCEVRHVDLAHPETPRMLECLSADATATAYIMVTVTPCDPWADANVTPLPEPLSYRLAAPCGVVAHNATWTAVAITETAGIIDGSYYGYRIDNSAPLWTPTILVYGTVPADELAAYPATWTAIATVEGTPHGWHLEGGRWVADGGRRP